MKRDKFPVLDAEYFEPHKYTPHPERKGPDGAFVVLLGVMMLALALGLIIGLARLL